MSQTETTFVIDANGQRGTIESMPSSQSDKNAPVVVRLSNGRQLLIPLDVLTACGDGTFALPFSLEEFVTSSPFSPSHQNMVGTMAEPSLASTTLAEHQLRAAAEGVVIPLAEEQVLVGKREVETGGVRIIKTVSERQETVSVPLIADHAEVERVPINRVVEAAPDVRREGETLIVPLLEEVLVVEKRLMLKEELHIRMRREETTQPQQVTLRREDVQIERFTGATITAQTESPTSISQNSAEGIAAPPSSIAPETTQPVLS